MGGENDLYQIGEVARECGASIDTIRYYEKLELIAKPQRTGGGFRRYQRTAVEQLRFIKKAQSFGFTLKEIKSIMRCSQEGLKPCCDLVRNLLEKKLEEFEGKMRELQRMRKGLKVLLSEWVPLNKARKLSYTVCPQIEKEPNKKRR